MNYELRTKNSRQRRPGYTLIELLVVLGILALTVGAIAMFLTSVLKGTNKANVSAEVKQNGQAILDSLERQIRGAAAVENFAGGNLKVTKDTGDYLFIVCQSGVGGKNPRIIELQTTRSTPPLLTSPVWKSASNDDTATGIDISNCKFSVYPADFSAEGAPIPAVVSISFDAGKAGQRADLSAKSTFETTISLRKY